MRRKILFRRNCASIGKIGKQSKRAYAGNFCYQLYRGGITWGFRLPKQPKAPALSGTTRLITFYSKPPYEITDKQKHKYPKRIKRQMPVTRFSQQKLQGIILNQSIRNNISTEPQYSFPINVYGILSMRLSPVCQYIDQRNTLNGKEADACLNHEQSYKQ